MLPNVYEFSWEPHRIVFVAFFLTVAGVLVAHVATSLWRSWRDVRAGRAGSLRWHEDFEELPEERRLCRHASHGDAAVRACENGFDCAHCERHRSRGPVASTGAGSVHGLEIRADTFYHRGHTWVRPEPDGRVKVGLTPLAVRMLPADARLRIPEPGEEIRSGDPAFVLADGSVRVLAPIEGRVVRCGFEDGLLTLTLDPGRPLAEHVELLSGHEAVGWMERELRQLQARLLGTEAASAWADGGAVADDLTRVVPGADWGSVRRDMFLDA
ncbi:MAG TPA: hypothetical protein VKA86_09620 [Candidatus Krumholzibacteria bacterium]|nr:hypothetical protein [Candidatus Krumholzibacteria bacterium]